MLVYVLNKAGKPLMPCKAGKARIFLKEKKAKVVKRIPFTIQLLHGSSGYKQKVTLGVDAGSKVVGLSATTEKKELYASELRLRTDIVDLLATKRQYRRSRRSRKTRYREARFLNRGKDSWLAPSIRHKIETHLTSVKRVSKLLPISNVIVEVASFDIQKIKNPEVSGEEYQQGEQLGFWNVREYVLFKDGHKCQHCKGKSKDKVLNVHHIESRKTGGDSPKNLLTLCETCHKAYHKGKIELKIKRGNSFRDAAFMGIMRWSFYNVLKSILKDRVKLTYGYLTKHKRITNGLPKAHYVDARCISGNPTAEPLGYYFFEKKVRCNNRQIHKATINKGGKRKLNQSPFIVKGFRLFDKVLYDGKECFITGRRITGSFALKTLSGEKISDGKSCKKLQLLEKRKTILTERRVAIPQLS